jgi:hypothetical protein
MMEYPWEVVIPSPGGRFGRISMELTGSSGQYYAESLKIKGYRASWPRFLLENLFGN